MKLKAFILSFSIITSMISCNSYTVLLKHQSHSVSVRNEDNSHVVAHLLVEKASHHCKNKLIYSSFKSGKIYQTQGAINGTALQGNYKVNFESGNLKEEGFYKDCKYETNKRKIYKLGCGFGKENDSLISGTRHGSHKTYYQNGKLKSISNFHCGLRQGNYYDYYENGNLETQEFYFEDKLKSSQYYNELGIIQETENIEYNFKKTRNYKTKLHKEFYENGDLKIENTIVEEENDIETEYYKEYYQNGFLKIEKTLINNYKNDIYREYFENGNVKYEGKFKNDKPIEKHYFYKEDGSYFNSN